MPDNFITVEEARQRLGVSKMTIARLIRNNILKAKINPIDQRVKLVRRQDIDKLKSTYPVKPAIHD
jgi:DeoR/GlpR family transcriptional regulator of sugar metabolism